jgi:hypothetical protein
MPAALRPLTVIEVTNAILTTFEAFGDLTMIEGLGALATVAGTILARLNSDERDAAELLFAGAVGAAMRAPIADRIGEPVGRA